MRGSRLMIFACVVLLAAPQHPGRAQNTPASAAEDLPNAQLGWGSDPAKRCPELRQGVANEGAVAVVKFMVGTTGVPSQASIRSSSGSSGFDAAALSCVPKLRFQAATRFGDGVPVESWRQFAFKWGGPVGAPQAARCEATGDVTQSAESGSAAHDTPGPARTATGVCVCVDETGKISQAPVLTSSSGSPGFDKAALELSSAAHYRPAVSGNGHAAAGCFRFRVGIEMK